RRPSSPLPRLSSGENTEHQGHRPPQPGIAGAGDVSFQATTVTRSAPSLEARRERAAFSGRFRRTPPRRHPSLERSCAMTGITDENLGPLGRRLKGFVIEPRGAGGRAATQAFNLAFIQEPALVALPSDEQDVVAVVEFAREYGMQIAPQRTGHNAEP